MAQMMIKYGHIQLMITNQLMFSFFFIVLSSSRCCHRCRLVSAAVISVHLRPSILKDSHHYRSENLPLQQLVDHHRPTPGTVKLPIPALWGSQSPGRITGTICILSLRTISDLMPPSISKARSRHLPKSALAFAICGASFRSLSDPF